MFKLNKDRTKYDLRKFYFTNRVVNAWNSLPDHVVLSETVNTLKSRLDKFWQHDIMISKLNFTEPEVAVYIIIRN